jgi:radical SAM superfamily enzyme YgiQ (UPF0313 family)
MEIVLATSPHVQHAKVLQNDFVPDPSSMYTFAPVGLLALSAVLRQDLSIEPTLFDLNRNIINGSIRLDEGFYRNAAERICEHKPDVLGFMTECDSYHHVLQIGSQVKEFLPQCRFVLGGPHASAVAKSTMERYAFVDAVAIGEGEHSFRDLILAYSNNSDQGVPGVLRRGTDGSIADAGVRPLVPSFEELPIPSYDLYQGNQEEEIFIEAGRGCPFKCTFCSTAPFWGRRHRVKSPTRILQEVRLVQSLFHSRRVHFTHDLLTTDRRWLVDLCQTLIDAGAPVRWTCSARTDTVDRELLAKMAAAGCNAIYFGVESGSKRILREIQKDVPIAQSMEILSVCCDLGITPNAGFIAGFPTEDMDSLSDTFNAFESALRLGTHPTHIFGFCPFVQSSLYKELTSLECHRHFLDIPIHPELDKANRDRIAADPDLFGSYFRPKAEQFGTLLYGIDEFSCLIEPVLLPALELARALGGMFELYVRWISWVEGRNKLIGASPDRRFYGTPLIFCEFITQELRKLLRPDHYLVELANVIHTSLEVSQQWSSMPPTAMASYRSVGMPKMDRRIGLSDHVRLNTSVATMHLTHDLTALLDASPRNAKEPEKKETYLMWHLAANGSIQLSEVDSFLHTVVGKLREGSQPVAALMVEWVQNNRNALDYERLTNVLTEARELDIVETI